MRSRLTFWICCVLLALFASARAAASPDPWQSAWQKGAMTADQTRGFMRELTENMVKQHLKGDGSSFALKNRARFGVAMVHAFRATEDPYYKQLLIRHVLPGCRSTASGTEENVLWSKEDAADAAVLIEVAWLLFSSSNTNAEQEIAADLAKAARQLYASPEGATHVVTAVAALTGADAQLMKSVPDFAQSSWRRPDNSLVGALYHRPAGKLESASGAIQPRYLYYAALARHETVPDALAFKLVYDALTEPILGRYACAGSLPVPGVAACDTGRRRIVDGRFERDSSELPEMRDAAGAWRKGPENMVLCGWALQALSSRGDLWEERLPGGENDEPVFIHEYPPGQGSELETPAAEFKLGEMTLALGATRRVLQIRGETSTNTPQFTLYSRPNGTGTTVRVTLDVQSGMVSAVNQAGDELRLENADVTKRYSRVRFKLSIPFEVVGKQAAWWTAVPHTRGSIQSGSAVENLYFTSEEEQVKRWLAWELSGGLRTWEAILQDRQGPLPGGSKSSDVTPDTEIYTALISAAAQWLNVLEGKRDWELLRADSRAMPPPAGARVN